MVYIDNLRGQKTSDGGDDPQLVNISLLATGVIKADIAHNRMGKRKENDANLNYLRLSKESLVKRIIWPLR